MALTRFSMIKRVLTDVCLVAIVGSILSIELEMLRPGLISAAVDISGVMLFALVLCGAIVTFGLPLTPLDRLESRYVLSMGVCIILLACVIISLHFPNHLLGLAMVGALVSIFLLSIYAIYNSRRHY